MSSHRKTKNSPSGKFSNITMDENRVQKTLNVVMSGFEGEQRGEVKHFISKIPWLILEQDMTYNIQVVVSNQIWTPKCKVATILQIPIVNKQWVLDSFRFNKIQSFENYLLGIFTGLRIGLLGFTHDEYDQISDFIIKQCGETTREIQDLISPYHQRTIIVIKSGNYHHYETLLNQLGHLICDSEWIRSCYKRNCFADTSNYILPRRNQQDTQLLQFPIEKQYDEYELNDSNYFNGVIAFICIKDDKLTSILQRFISLGEGYFINEYLPIVTHIISLELPTNIQMNNEIFFVYPQWISDSFFYRKRMIETDYQIHKIDIIQNKLLLNDVSMNLPEFQLDKQNSISTQTFGLTKFPFQNNPQIINQQQQQQQQQQIQQRQHERTLKFSGDPRASVRKSQKQIQSKIFNGLLIYIIESPIAREIKHQIGDHSGQCEIFKEQIQSSKPHIILLGDSNDNPKIVKKVGTKNSQIFSYRWVRYCIEQRMVELKVREKCLFFLLPTNYPTPIDQLLNKEIYVSIRSLNDKISFRQMVSILTGRKIQQFNPNTVQYFVTDKCESKKISQIDKSIVRHPSWLIELFQTGKFN